MDLSRSPSEIADAAAEEVRALNHVTISRGAYTEPAHISSTVSRLQAVVAMLPQALQQAGNGLERLRDNERGIRIDSGADAGQTVAAVATALGLAREHLAAAEDALRRAGNRLSTMGRPWPEDAGDDD